MVASETMMTPQPVDDVTLAFPAKVMHLLPEWDAIPAEFARGYSNEFVIWVERWFYSGADSRDWQAKEGIDSRTAWRHMQACTGSFEPKHEHKIAGVAYLLSLWFDRAKATPAPRG